MSSSQPFRIYSPNQICQQSPVPLKYNLQSQIISQSPQKIIQHCPNYYCEEIYSIRQAKFLFKYLQQKGDRDITYLTTTEGVRYQLNLSYPIQDKKSILKIHDQQQQPYQLVLIHSQLHYDQQQQQLVPQQQQQDNIYYQQLQKQHLNISQQQEQVQYIYYDTKSPEQQSSYNQQQQQQYVEKIDNDKEKREREQREKEQRDEQQIQKQKELEEQEQEQQRKVQQQYQQQQERLLEQQRKQKEQENIKRQQKIQEDIYKRQQQIYQIIREIYKKSSDQRSVSEEKKKYIQGYNEKSELFKNYNITKLQRKNDLCKICNGFLEVRGDGNCFYTAFGYQFIEHLLITYNDNEFNQFINQIKSINLRCRIILNNLEIYNQEQEKQILDEFLYQIQQLRNIQNIEVRKQSLQIQFSEYQVEQNGTGFLYPLSTIFFRNLVDYLIEQNEQAKIQIGNDKKSLLIWETECNSNEIVINELAQYLQLKIILIFFENQNFTVRQYNEEKQNKIILLIKPGHYNIGMKS